MKFSENCRRVPPRIPAGQALGRASRCAALPGAREARPPSGAGRKREAGRASAPGSGQLPARSLLRAIHPGVKEGGPRLYWDGHLGEPPRSGSESIIRSSLLHLGSPSSTTFPFPPLSRCSRFGVFDPTFKSFSVPDLKPQTQHYNAHFCSETGRNIYEKIIYISRLRNSLVLVLLSVFRIWDGGAFGT